MAARKGVIAPFFDEGGHVVGQRLLEMHVAARGGMLETQDAGMQRLARTEGETVFDELFVLAEGGPLEDDVAPIGGIAEEGVPDVFHVGTDLVRAACLEDALDEGDVAETLEDMPVGDSMFAAVGVGGDMHDAAVGRVPLEVADNGAVVFVEIAPDEGLVFALDGVVEKLFGQDDLRLLGLGYEEESGGVFVDAVDEEGGRGVELGVEMVQ